MTLLKIYDPDTQTWIEIGGGDGVTDHGELTGLENDDHTQYILADGTRNFTGFPETPAEAPASDYELANKKYVDDSVVAASGTGGSPGNPTASVGLTPVNGTAVTYMRSDAAPPIDQGIIPTWSEDHEFTKNITLADTISSAVGVIMKGAVSFLHNFHPAGVLCGNTFIGEDAGNFTLTSSAKYLTAIGYQALKSITSGTKVVAIGYKALTLAQLPVDCVAIGFNALGSAASTAVQKNVAIGSEALLSLTTGDNNLAIGSSSLDELTTGYGNTAIGVSALSHATEADYNDCLGYAAGVNITTGNYNVSVGSSSIYNVTTADSNLGLGYRAGRYRGIGTTALANPASGIYIGTQARGFADGEVNSIVIGTQAIGKGSNTVVLGNENITDTHLGGLIHLNDGNGVNEFSTDGTLAGNSDTAVPTEKAVKTYVDNSIPSGTSGYVWTQAIFTGGGELEVGSGYFRIYAPVAMTIDKVFAAVTTAPTGDAIIVDVNKNGTTIFTTQGSRPSIAATEYTDESDTPDVTTLAAGDYLTFDIDQIGSTVAGSNITVHVRCKQTISAL